MPRSRWWAVVLLGLAGLLPAWTAPGRAGDWPGWRGPTGMGLTEEKDLPLTWGGKGNENVLWKAPLPGSDGKARPDQNQSSPIVWRDRVFITASYWPAGVAHPEREFPQHHVLCYQVADGKQLWDRVVAPGPWLLKDLRGGYTAPTPATDGRRVYVLFGSAVLAALDLDGRTVWRKEIVPHTFDVAIGASPVLFEDSVILLCGMADRKDSRIVAFHKDTGELKWETRRPAMGFAHGTPLVIRVKDKPLLVVAASGAAVAPDALLGLAPATGEVVWWCRGAGDASSPVFGDGIVYADSGRGGPGVAVDPGGAGDVSQSRIRWTVPRVPEGLSSAVITAGSVYRVHEPGVLKCWKAATGEQVYAERLGGVSSWSSPFVDAGGLVYLANSGKTFVIRAGPKPEVVAVNDLGDPGRASAAVAGGRIFLKGQRSLYCVGRR